MAEGRTTVTLPRAWEGDEKKRRVALIVGSACAVTGFLMLQLLGRKIGTFLHLGRLMQAEASHYADLYGNDTAARRNLDY